MPDNFEHVLPAAVRIAELLRACPKLKILATSRSPLHVEGEREMPVPPMAIPVAPLRALHLFGAAAAVSTTRGTRLNLFDRILRGRWLSVAERAIGEPAAAEAISRGRAAGPAQGKALALENRP